MGKGFLKGSKILEHSCLSMWTTVPLMISPTSVANSSPLKHSSEVFFLPVWKTWCRRSLITWGGNPPIYSHGWSTACIVDSLVVKLDTERIISFVVVFSLFKKLRIVENRWTSSQRALWRESGRERFDFPFMVVAAAAVVTSQRTGQSLSYQWPQLHGSFWQVGLPQGPSTSRASTTPLASPACPPVQPVGSATPHLKLKMRRRLLELLTALDTLGRVPLMGGLPWWNLGVKDLGTVSEPVDCTGRTDGSQGNEGWEFCAAF